MKKAIITLYNPSQENIKNVFNILKQVDEIIVCDNSSVSHEEYFLQENISYFSICENLGLSESFSRVLKDTKYMWNDDDYIFFFDQDSKVAENHLTTLISEYESLISLGYEVGCIGPIYYNNSSGIVEIPKMKIKLNKYSFSVKGIITSSMLTTYKNLKTIGFWNDEIFLDMADWDLCWRFIEKNFLCCLTNRITLNHTLGEGDKKIFGFRVKTSNPIREYYQTRDCLYLFKKKYVPIKYKIRFIAMITIRPIIHLMFLDNRKDRLNYILAGVKDFFNNKHGEFKPKVK